MKSGLEQSCDGNFAEFSPSADSLGSQRTGKCMYIKAWRIKRNFALAAQDPAVDEGGKAPVSPCVPLCAILLAKASVYTLSLVKANVGRLCKKLKIGLRNGLEQRCGGNFLAIFAGMVLGEKPNFLSRIFGQ